MNVIQVLSSQPWIPRLASTLLHFLWQGALVAAIYAVARRVSGKRTARFHYCLACGALAVMVLAPIVTFEIFGASPVPSGGLAPGGFAIPAPSTGTLWTTSTTTTSVEIAPGNATAWIVLVWFAGLLALSMRLFAGWLVASRMRSMLVRPTSTAVWQRELDRLSTPPAFVKTRAAGGFGTGAGPDCHRLAAACRSGSCGNADGASGPELVEALLAHELAHIRRHDYLINVLQGFAEAALFYHPAVWWISHHVREERERCCDDIAVAVCGDPLTYVRALTELESCRQEHLTPVLAAER